jgi:hypothetical protein
MCFVTLFNKICFLSTTLDFPVILDGQFSSSYRLLCNNKARCNLRPICAGRYVGLPTSHVITRRPTLSHVSPHMLYDVSDDIITYRLLLLSRTDIALTSVVLSCLSASSYVMPVDSWISIIYFKRK